MVVIVVVVVYLLNHLIFQAVNLTNWPASGDSVDEVQKITVSSLDETLHFRLRLHGVSTGLYMKRCSVALSS